MRGLIVIPTYNECDNIELIVHAVLDLPYDFHALVVDDNSPDGTGAIADRMAAENDRVHVLHNPVKKGIGPAYISGFKWGLAKGYDLLFEMDSDFSHRPEYLHDFMEAIADADLVLGSRYKRGVNVVQWPLSRLLLSYFANVYSRKITGVQVHDLTGGFKCFRREVLESIDLDRINSSGYTFQIEMTMRAHAQGFRIVEVPIIFYDRQRGASKMSFAIAREAVWMVWKLRLLKLIGKL